MKAKLLVCGADDVGGADGQAAAGTEVGLVTLTAAEPGTAQRPETAAGDPEGDWLCAWCHNRVANEKDRFPYNGQDEFTFANPEGIRFEIITFSRTLSVGKWAPPRSSTRGLQGHAWSFCQCERCGQQLGWYYAGPHQFAGLIKGRIVRALQVNN